MTRELLQCTTGQNVEKIKGNGKTISELEKNEKLDKNLLRFLTVKVKKFDLKTNYFEKKSNEMKEKAN